MDLTLPALTIGKGSWSPKLVLGREDHLCSVYERERRFAGGLGRRRADKPQHCREFVDPLLAMLLEFVGAPCLEALEDLRVGVLSLTVAAQMSNEGVEDVCAEFGALGLE